MAKIATNLHARKSAKPKVFERAPSNIARGKGKEKNVKQSAKKRIKKQGIFTMKADIYKRLQKEAEFNSVSSLAMVDLHSMVNYLNFFKFFFNIFFLKLRDMTDKLIFMSGNLAKREGRNLINPRDIQAAAKFTFNPASDITAYICRAGNFYLTKFLDM